MIATTGVRMPGAEDQLVTRCREGDQDAFAQVYTQYERQVFRYAYHLLGNREDADDITTLESRMSLGCFPPSVVF